MSKETLVQLGGDRRVSRFQQGSIASPSYQNEVPLGDRGMELSAGSSEAF
jgi:hypothetical protein